MVGEDGLENVPHRNWLIIFDRVLNEVKAEMKERGREGEFIGARVSGPLGETFRIHISFQIIYTTIRFVSPEELDWYLEDCIALKKEFPHLIAGEFNSRVRIVFKMIPIHRIPGFDLVGQEDNLKPLIDYIEPLLRFQKRQKEEGVDIPFIFHAGETLGDGTQADVNIYDAILLGTKRIGHGFSLVKHPKIMETCRERGIAIEVCPIS